MIRVLREETTYLAHGSRGFQRVELMTGSGANRWEWVEQQLRAQLEIGSRERVLEMECRLL